MKPKVLLCCTTVGLFLGQAGGCGMSHVQLASEVIGGVDVVWSSDHITQHSHKACPNSILNSILKNMGNKLVLINLIH